ncbi:hypothetical protein HY486_04960 [Candidatus Woesearchaeota archaeon]|nr:hypothetical protein [Candidatus Woesearchaeota archaeon]
MNHDNRKKDILNVLRRAQKALQQKDYRVMAEASNHVIHDASIYQDEDTIHTAIIIYALSKVMQKCLEKNTTINITLKESISAVENDNYTEYNRQLKNVAKTIQKTDDKISAYVTEVIEKARLKKGYKMHEHGLSTAKISELLGISQWELQNYLGKTIEKQTGKRDRLEIARQIFS